MSRKCCLLIVEDDLAVLEALANVLAAANYHVLPASSSHEAILAFDPERVDAVLLDLNLEKEDGWLVFDALRKLNPALPIVVASAQPHRLVHSSARKANAIIEKPFELSALLDLLRNATLMARSEGSLSKGLSTAPLDVA